MDDKIRTLFERGTYDNGVDVDVSAVNFVLPGGGSFFLVIGVSGKLRIESHNGQIMNSIFPAGPVPCRCKKVYTDGGNTATDIKAFW